MKKLLVALLMLPAMACAEFWTGNDVYNKLQNSEVLERMLGLGYIMGVYDVGVHARFCPGREGTITAGQLNDMVRNWLYQNAQRRHESGEKLITEIFRQTWPCANRGAKSTI